MKFLSYLVLFLPVLLFSCCPAPNSTEAAIADALNQAAYHFSQGLLGPLAGGPPPSAGGPDDPNCGSAPTPSYWDDPGEGISSAGTGACSKSYPEDTDCNVCVKASCCAEAFACVGEETCTCNLAPSLGVSWPTSSPCPEPDAAYDAIFACLSEHCTECFP